MALSRLGTGQQNMEAETNLNGVNPANIHMTVRDHERLNRLLFARLSICVTQIKSKYKDG